MYMPHPPASTLRVHVHPHPTRGEPAVCFHVELNDGHVFDLWFDRDDFVGMIGDMHEALTDLDGRLATWALVDCPSVEGTHLMPMEAFAHGRRRALCGMHPPKGEQWEAVPLVEDPDEENGVCQTCLARWTPETPR